MKEHDYCRFCGGFVDYDKTIQLLSYPPKYRGKCRECGTDTIEFCHKVDKVEDDAGTEM